MATWQEVKSFVKSNYSGVAETDDGTLITMTFVYPEDANRTQMVGVANSGGPWIRFMSIVGTKSEVNLERLFEECKIFGVTLTEGSYFLVHNQLLETVDTAEINEALSWVAAAADDVEKVVTSGRDVH